MPSIAHRPTAPSSAQPAPARPAHPARPGRPARVLNVGLDVGSTTVKTLVIDPTDGTVLHWSYKRHNARQLEGVVEALEGIEAALGPVPIRLAVCGSGAQGVAEALKTPYIQEVVANALTVRALYPQVRCAIELGGQDAKMVFFRTSETTGRLEVADMRMNGSCAGGTGAFIDEIAALLKVPVEQFDELASRGRALYDISGRCGVYAKTDIQPLLNQGARKEDIALSALHAVAKQTIGGLAQGLDIQAPVAFEGGVLTYIPTLVRVFAERLGLGPDDIVLPERPQTVVAQGAALALGETFSDAPVLPGPAAAARILRDDPRAAQGFMEGEAVPVAPLFADAAERAAFERRHAPAPAPAGPAAFATGTASAVDPASAADPASATRPVVHAYLGVDAGSTTTKMALVSPAGELLDAFYGPNGGESLEVARRALVDLRQRWRDAGVDLRIDGVGTTGYGEDLFAHALHADYHTVETVAHARAATRAVPDATFVLDIGGQDMKAIWLDHGVLTDIVVNEACSSGCGSFLENFAATLGIPVEGIAQAAFASRAPAALGSRCTVFMNSGIVSEQRRGKTPEDIMAGLCRSIVENVFTKVVRVANTDSLGPRVVVQGGTFANDAVLRCLELYLGREVVRAPHPGLAGAIGIALLTQEAMEGAEGADKPGAGEKPGQTRTPRPSRFIGLDAVDGLGYTQTANIPCPHCANRCARTLIRFNDGTSWVTGNRCPRGERIEEDTGSPAPSVTAPAPRNLFETRQRLLFQRYPVRQLVPERGVTVGLPRVLALWDNAPFWTTFLRALGFSVKLSHLSTRAMYERGLSAVTSDTVCFPAKLAHGHIRDLVDAGVDRIFMPVVTTVPSENTAPTSESMCAVVKGYPLVLRNSDDPERRWGVPFDNPLFHWYSDADRDRQLTGYMEKAFGVAPSDTRAAIEQGDAAQRSFREALLHAGQELLDEVGRTGGYAVVLASRPYHNDPLVNHDLPRIFCEQGVSVLPPDALPGVNEQDLSRSRLDIVNNFHARMLGSALVAARDPRLEYAQIVSFGCGHDAYLSDEIVRLTRATSPHKAPLILKVDESDAGGPLRIRVRSFVETVNARRARCDRPDEGATPRAAASTAGTVVSPAAATAAGATFSPATEPTDLPDPYPQKYVKADRRQKVILVPNTSHAFARLLSAALRRQGARAEALDVGREEAIRLGKKYVHNDICFPAQITIGEALAALESGRYDDTQVAIGTAKYVGDCRLTHYQALLRKALDDAGYAHVPLITNDGADAHNAHPGFRLSLASSIDIAFGLPLIDVLEELLRKMRPYELEPGSTDRAFDAALDAVIEGVERHGVRGGLKGFERAIDIMASVRYDRSEPRPTVLIVGEYVLNFHPGANHDVEAYLEANGLEVIEARMTDVIRKTYFYKDAQVKEYHVEKPLRERAWYAVANRIFELAHDACDRIAVRHPLYERAVRLPELVRASDPVMHHTFDAGEGVLIPGEILHHASRGCRTFLILQPFGCLPNHVCGRGLVKRLREMYPDAQILSLDYDPDVSFANIENRLQMLVMNARGEQRTAGAGAGGGAGDQHDVDGQHGSNDQSDNPKGGR